MWIICVKIKSNYFKGGHGEEWESIVKSCAEEMSQQKGYWEGIKQEICHLVGICASWTKSYTGKRPMENGYSWRLRNIVFNPKAEACNDSPYDNYKRLYTEFKKQVKKQVGTKMNSLIEIMDYKPIWSAICKAFPDECDPYRKFIWERYMQFAAEWNPFISARTDRLFKLWPAPNPRDCKVLGLVVFWHGCCL